MIYSFEITTPASTLFSNPQQIEAIFPKGLMYKIDVDFPIGSQGLLYTRAMSADVQLYPFTRNEWFRGQNYIISFEDKSFFETESGIITFETVNLDDYYEHLVTWRIGIVTDQNIISSYLGYSQLSQQVAQVAETQKVLMEMYSGKKNGRDSAKKVSEIIK